ncbi:hypothetical protein ACH5RR_023198 [Cinchona calisaya]|uniref:Uncharacterized protein n=1 Tax=Cinchona calisaya TaxID=153742 RepID=A0ABD2ZBV1_9GENT
MTCGRLPGRGGSSVVGGYLSDLSIAVVLSSGLVDENLGLGFVLRSLLRSFRPADLLACPSDLYLQGDDEFFLEATVGAKWMLLWLDYLKCAMVDTKHRNKSSSSW